MSDVVGIDLGTTNSVVAAIDESDRPFIVPNVDGKRITPSVVQVAKNGELIVGDAALADLPFEAESTARFFKRDMENEVRYDYRGRSFTPIDFSAAVLSKLKCDAEAHLGRPVRRAVVTVPAYFLDAGRLRTQKAAQMAGLEVLQIINEPTAAALAYGLRVVEQEQLILVYDLGGGTFDITLVRISGEEIDVVGTDGNHTLGGKDWDDRLVIWAADELRLRTGYDAMSEPGDLQVLYAEAEKVKKELSARLSSAMTLELGGSKTRLDVTREQFESLTTDLLGQTEQLVQKVLNETHTSASSVDSILLVGGSSRMPGCHALAERLTGRKPNQTVNPDECVALGAAVCGALHDTKRKSLRGLPSLRVRDVMSHSLGMIAVNADGDRYVNTILLARNQRIPCSESRPYRVTTSGDDSVSVYVTQGEDDSPLNCSFVGKYVIDLAHGSDIIDIRYEYDQSGIVNVAATPRGNETRLHVRKEPLPEDMSWLTRPPGWKAPLPPRTVYLAIDLSGSMAGRPLRDAQAAMRRFVESSDLTNTAIGIIAFADSRRVILEAVRDAKQILRAIASLKINIVGIGNREHPFQDAERLLKDVNGVKFVVILADGVWSCQREAIDASLSCRNAGIEVIAIGFGSADHDFLRQIASADQSALFNTSAQLTQAFEQIAQVVLDGGSLRAMRKR